MQTLQERIVVAARQGRSVSFPTGQATLTVSWAELHDQARRAAGVLAQHGVGPGSRVGLLGPTSRELVAAIQAVWLRGATVVVLPLPMRLASIEGFATQTRAHLRSAAVDLVVMDPGLADVAGAAHFDRTVLALSDLDVAAGVGRVPGPGPVDVITAVDPDTLAVLQFTSGSTSDPKGVALPHRAVCANLDAIARSVDLDPGTDVVAAWLPLYHDMGLVGVLALTMSTGTELVLGTPHDFLADPVRWMRWVSDHQATATAGPNFSWALAARALRRLDPARDGRDHPALDLSSLRIALTGAEPVDPGTVADFVEAARPFGFRPGAVFPAYGLAEVAIAATFPPEGRGLATDVVDRSELERSGRAVPCPPGPGAREIARLGRPVPGLELRIVSVRTGRVVAEREVGEVELRGTSVCAGYDGRPELDASLFHRGWLRTGDLGYLVDGELVVCGRLKDVIVLGGRNIHPEDVERACTGVEGTRPGNVVAFGIDRRGTKEGIVVVAETRVAEPSILERALRSRVIEVTGVPPSDVVLVGPGTVPKTTSGKLQRSACRDEYLAGRLGLLVGVAV